MLLYVLKSFVQIPASAGVGEIRSVLSICKNSLWASCRCVVVVGMPYPNPQDPELSERMRSLDVQDVSTQQPLHGQPTPGQVFYEDLCMKVDILC